MQAFRITLELARPVIAPFGISLDGLLAHARVLSGHEIATAHIGLPLREVEGIYQASEFLFVGPSPKERVNYVRLLNAEKWDQGAFRPKRGTSLNKVTAREELKNLVDNYEAIDTPAALAWGVGAFSHFSVKCSPSHASLKPSLSARTNWSISRS
jgi:hypothetical protein